MLSIMSCDLTCEEIKQLHFPLSFIFSFAESVEHFVFQILFERKMSIFLQRFCLLSRIG